MADKRMFSKKITNSDAFLDMPKSSQALYFHLNMSADDDGFIDSPRMIMRMIGAADDDMRLLITKRFILEFETGVVVIKDWIIHNTIRKDRKKTTIHTEEFKRLTLAENGSYQLDINNKIPDDNQVTTECRHRLDKIRLDKIRLDEDSLGEDSGAQPQNESPVDDSYIFPMFEKEFGRPLSPMELETVSMWLTKDNYSADIIQLALREAVINKAFSFKYIDRILLDWEKNNVRTTEDAKKRIESHNAKQQSRQSNYQRQPIRQEILPEWAKNPVKEEKLSLERQAELQKELDELLSDSKKQDEAQEVKRQLDIAKYGEEKLSNEEQAEIDERIEKLLGSRKEGQ